MQLVHNLNSHLFSVANKAMCNKYFLEQIYDVPMKFASKLIHGGQCTFAIIIGEGALAQQIWLKPYSIGALKQKIKNKKWKKKINKPSET